jgi:hypothetical protein
MAVLSDLRETLPRAVFVASHCGMLVQCEIKVDQGQPVLVTYSDGFLQVEHIGGPTRATLFGGTISELTYFQIGDVVPDQQCGLCGKTGVIRYVTEIVEFACLMCHMWMLETLISNESLDFTHFILVSIKARSRQYLSMTSPDTANHLMDYSFNGHGS